MALYNYITVNGTIIPDTSTIKEEVEAEYKAIYGADFVVDSSTEQGREIDAEITSRISVVRNNAKLANQINPNLSDGVFLDANYALMGGERDGAEQSTVECDLTGVVGTVIAANAFVEDDNAQLWFLVDEVTIPLGNTIQASFRSVEYGEINAGIGAINKIITGIIGWETVNNPSSAIPGKLEQNDVSTRRQRKVELGKNSKSNAYSIIAAINSLEGVAGVSYRENIENIVKIIDNVTMLPHSNYVCVDGGVDSEIAEAYQIKSGGSNYTGTDVTVQYTDPDSGQVIPVKFDRPTEKPMIIRVTARVSSSTNAVQDIKDAVINYANGGVDNENGFSLGENTSPFEIGSAVNVTLADVFINKCEVGTVSGGVYGTDTIENEIFEKATIEEFNIDVVIL